MTNTPSAHCLARGSPTNGIERCAFEFRLSMVSIIHFVVQLVGVDKAPPDKKWTLRKRLKGYIV